MRKEGSFLHGHRSRLLTSDVQITRVRPVLRGLMSNTVTASPEGRMKSDADGSIKLTAIP